MRPLTVLKPRPVPQTAAAETRLAPPIPRLDPITRLPLLILYPHSWCNCRCLMCDIWKATTRDEIHGDEISAWLDEWRGFGVERVVLSGGEPLMHSDLWRMCAELREAGIGITLLSTGILLKRNAERIAEFCDDVVVSLDGPREVHDSIRNIPRAFDKLAAGVAAVKTAGPQVSVTGRSTVQRANFRYLRRTVAAAHEVGFERISFLAVDVTSEAFNREGGWAPERVAETALERDELPELEAELEALERENADDFASGFIAESAEKLHNRLLVYFSATAGQGDFAPVNCNAPWVSTVIEADGAVRPCFFQPPLGNLREAGSLDAVLNSPEAIAWRKGLDTHRDEICRRCVCSLELREGD